MVMSICSVERKQNKDELKICTTSTYFISKEKENN